MSYFLEILNSYPTGWMENKILKWILVTFWKICPVLSHSNYFLNNMDYLKGFEMGWQEIKDELFIGFIFWMT